MSESFTTSLYAFALTALVIEVTPGPNMGYLAVLSLARGWQAGVAAVTGVALGHAAYGVAAALGVAAVIDRSPLLYGILRWAGVAYMFWLAYEAWASEAETSPDVVRDHYSSSWLAFRRGLIANLLNPKAAVFFVTVVPTFMRPDGSVVMQTLVLSGLFVAIATVVHLAIVIMANRVQHFANEPERRRPVRRALAVVLAGIAIWFGFSSAR
jgi:threonine/homoserine/homoserine lactone efflux protein